MAQNTTPKQTKKAQLIGLLSGTKPVSLDALSSALGWQRHTTSAAMTRLKQAGHNIISEKIEGAADDRTYRIDVFHGQPHTNPGGKISGSSTDHGVEAEQ